MKSWRAVLSWPVLGTAWIVISLLYIQTQVGWGTLGSMLPQEIATTVLGILAPLAFIWLATNSQRRAADMDDLERRLTQQIAATGNRRHSADTATQEASDALRRRAVDLASTAEAVSQRLDRVTAALGDQLTKSVNMVLDAAQRSEGTRENLESASAEIGRLAAAIASNAASVERAAGRDLAGAAERLSLQVSVVENVIERAFAANADRAADRAREIETRLVETLQRTVERSVDALADVGERVGRETGLAAERVAGEIANFENVMTNSVDTVSERIAEQSAALEQRPRRGSR